jgi:hypothetical protein
MTAALLQLLETVEDVRALLASLLANKDLVVLAQVTSLLDDVCLYTRSAKLDGKTSARAIGSLYRPLQRLRLQSVGGIEELAICTPVKRRYQFRASKDVASALPVDTLRTVTSIDGANVQGTFTALHMNILVNACPNLVHLNLEGVDCVPDAFADIGHLQTLNSLRLRQSGRVFLGTRDFMGIRLPPSLKCLVVTGWVTDFKHLAVALKTCPNIHTIHLPRNDSMMPENDYLFECLLTSCPNIRNLVAPSGTSCPELYTFVASQHKILETLTLCLHEPNALGILRRVPCFPSLHTLTIEGNVQHQDVYYVDAILQVAPALTHLSFGSSSSRIYSNIRFLAPSRHFNVKHLRIQGVMYSTTLHALAYIANSAPSLETVNLIFFNQCPDILEDELSRIQSPGYVRSTCRFSWTFHISE